MRRAETVSAHSIPNTRRAARSREELRRGVARRCGHVLLCRPCSDFVCACPKCGAHVAGVGLAVR